MHFDFTISLTTILSAFATILQLLASLGLWKILRFINLQKDFPPHRHINGTRIIYPKDYAPERAQTMESSG